MMIQRVRAIYDLLGNKYKRKGIIICLLLVIQSALDVLSLAVFFPIFVLIVDPVIVERNRFIAGIYEFFDFGSHTSFILALISVILIFVVLKNLASIRIASIKARYAFGIGSDLAAQSLSHYMQMSFVDYSRVDFTRELNRIASHPIAFANNIILPLTALIAEGLVTVFILGCIAFFDIKILLLLSVILLPAVFLFQLRKNNLKEVSNSLKVKFPLLLKYTQQVVEGLPEINVFMKQAFFQKRFTATSNDLDKTFAKEHTIQMGTIRFTEIIVTVIICFLVVYSVLLDQPYQQTVVLLGLYAGASFRVIPSLNRILIAIQQMRAHEYLFEELKISGNINAAVDDALQRTLTFNESLSLNKISLSM
jgi:ABC-type multidrug transport system fused ATPase/permease subunit